MKALAARTSPAFGFSIIAFSFFLLSFVAVLPLAARVITCWRLPAEQAAVAMAQKGEA